MQPDIAEWVAKAEADWATARREFQARRQTNFDAVCFHSQQCIEKYLKARLILADVSFPKTHNLVLLLALLQKTEPFWQPWKESLAKLTTYAVAFRYPGESAERADADETLKIAKLLRAEIRFGLGLAAKKMERRK